MVLHLGADVTVPLKDVIAIFDLKYANSPTNQQFLQTMTEEEMISDVSDGKPKSFVLTDKTVYLSAISSLTLKKRADNIYSMDNDDL
jgi:hypothetical protein